MFKVGDIITGIDSIAYAITTDKAIMEVMAIDNDMKIIVKVLKHIDDDYDEWVGEDFAVTSKYFKLAREKTKQEKLADSLFKEV